MLYTEGHKKIADMTPTEFEMLGLNVLKGYAETEGLKDFKITHNKKIKTSDGRYQIDVYAEFTTLGTKIKVLCECKKYKNRVNRDKVTVLHKKLESIGAHKGILISTSDYQSGAIKYAEAHGIALIRANDYNYNLVSHSSGTLDLNTDDPFVYLENKWPSYEAFVCTAKSSEPKKVYPTRAMVAELFMDMNEKVKETMGVSIDFDFK